MSVNDTIETIALFSALGAGVVAGVFYAFSSFVMEALARMPVDQGIRAMQMINITVINPWFFLVFFGTALGAMIVMAYGWLHLESPGAAGLITGGTTYLVGTILVTGLRNVPLNNKLAKVDPASAEGGTVWKMYLRRWTAWNHLRTAASVAATVLLVLALQ
jgi:uncharacterized membrane protein